MAEIVVQPETFSFVLFDAAHIAALVGDLADRAGVPADERLRIEVDERTPLGRTRVTSLDPITIAVEGGAFEDAKHPRHLSEQSVTSVVGRLLLRALDRRDPAFGAPPEDSELTLPHYVAWDVYSVARCGRMGYPVQKERRRYHFRIRHGFTDVADRTFERLWTADGLTWKDLARCSDEALAAAPPGAAEPDRPARTGARAQSKGRVASPR
ncbi:MAG: hypothetical protein ACYDAD_12275 [Acidimicrobiales bacterium]